MKDFRQHFLTESIEKLQNLIADLENKENLSEAEKCALFRDLHTIKGTSQTFGLNVSSRLAHNLEDLLGAKVQDKNFNQILLEGIGFLRKSFEQNDFEIPEEFIEKLKKLAPTENHSPDFKQIIAKLPPEISANLSSPEKSSLCAELQKGKNLFGAEIGFQPANFSAGFKDFREILTNSGVIIAAFPSAKFTEAGKIGFQILFASFEHSAKISEIIEKFSAQIIFDTSPEIFAFDLPGVLAQTVSHGKTVAESLGKSVEFEVSAGNFKVSEKSLQLLFDALVHLTRNAVDHAFETSGKIKIELKSKETGLFLKFSDDGCGIDLEKIREKAGKKNLFKENFTNEATLHLIFQSEFSTAPEITKISGRGVGLDAVKTAVEAANGNIKVKSKLNKGTIFEIFLPNE